MRFREDRPADLDRARTAVTAWRDQNPAGTCEELIAAVGGQFHRDYGVVLRAVLFAVDRHRAREITGDITEIRGRPVSGSSARLTRPALRMVPDEPDQAFRLREFCTAHPEAIVGRGEFGTWQARIPHASGEVVTIRYTLRQLLDRLHELIAERDGEPGQQPPDGSLAT